MPMRRLSFLPPPPPAQDHIPGPAAPTTSSSSTSRRGGEKDRLPPQRRRTTMAIGNRKDAEGLLASLRRFSLDSPLESQQGEGNVSYS
jgi:hypothetical protein